MLFSVIPKPVGSIYTHACVGFADEIVSNFKITSPMNGWQRLNVWGETVSMRFNVFNLKQIALLCLHLLVFIIHLLLWQRCFWVFLQMIVNPAEGVYLLGATWWQGSLLTETQAREGRGSWVKASNIWNNVVKWLSQLFMWLTNIPLKYLYLRTTLFLPFISISAGTRR